MITAHKNRQRFPSCIHSQWGSEVGPPLQTPSRSNGKNRHRFDLLTDLPFPARPGNPTNQATLPKPNRHSFDPQRGDFRQHPGLYCEGRAPDHRTVSATCPSDRGHSHPPRQPSLPAAGGPERGAAVASGPPRQLATRPGDPPNPPRRPATRPGDPPNTAHHAQPSRARIRNLTTRPQSELER